MNDRTENLLGAALRTAKPAFVYAALFSFFINLMMLLVPLYSLQVLDRVMSSGSHETLFWLSAIMVANFLAAGGLLALRSFTMVRIGEWMDGHLSAALLANSLAHAAKTGARGTQNLRDLGAIRGFATGNGLMTLFDMPWSVIALAVIFCMHVQLGMITFFGSALLMALAWFNELAMKKPLDEANALNVRNYQQVDIAMRNAEAIEAMGMTKAVSEYWQKINSKISSLQSLASNRSAIVQALTRFLRLDLQIAITGWGAYLALNHELTSGGIIAASILAARALAPFDAAIAVWKSAIDARTSWHRLNAELNAMTAATPGISLPAPKGRLVVDHVVYAPPGRNRAVIKNLSFALEAGDSLVVIGPSAAGKSTLAKLIVGAWKPYSGVIRLDDADVGHWRREEFGKHIGYLPQEIELFSGTVRDNIARLCLDAPDAMVVEAARMAGAHELILSLPNGYHTEIRHGALSAGQRQRIGLARACFGSPKLLVLDEPDSNLDGDGEQALMQTLVKAKLRSITTVLISHRQSFFGLVNRMLVLNDGELRIFGPTMDVLDALSSKKGSLAGKPSETHPYTKPKRRPQYVPYSGRA